MSCNEPNIIIRDNKKDMSDMDRTISGDRNVIKERTEKFSKYKHRTIVIKYMKNLTLRLLMLYIYIYMERIFLMFLDHTQRRTTVGRTPLDE